MPNIDDKLKAILADFVTGDIEQMPIEQIKQAFAEEQE